MCFTQHAIIWNAPGPAGDGGRARPTDRGKPQQQQLLPESRQRFARIAEIPHRESVPKRAHPSAAVRVACVLQ